jgi:hypothetical protein
LGIVMLSCTVPWTLDLTISMQPRWNDTYEGKPKYSERNVSQCYFSNANTTWIGSSSNPSRRGERLTAWSMNCSNSISKFTSCLTENVVVYITKTKLRMLGREINAI